MTATAEVSLICPKCGGPCWDQKNGKFPWKPGTPIAKCKTKECASNGGVIWEPRNPAQAAKPAPVKVAYNTPKALPNEFDGFEDEETAELHAHTQPQPSKGEAMLALHNECFKLAYTRLKKANEASDPALIFTGSDVLAYTAQLFIEANRKGLTSLAA